MFRKGAGRNKESDEVTYGGNKEAPKHPANEFRQRQQF